jgi:DNA-binding NarL/FixJ family response regulator
MVKLIEFAEGDTFPQHSKDALKNIDKLSKREQEILFLLSMGIDNVQIGEKLFIAEQTVKNHVSKIYFKLQTHDRNSAARLAKTAHLEQFFGYLKEK